MNIIRPDSYDDKTTLMQNIELLADKNIPLNDKEIVNLVAKYFFAYIYPESTDQGVPLAEIDEKFRRGAEYCDISRTKASLDNISVAKYSFLQKFHEAGYGLTMLGDISSTAVIVKDVIERKINAEDFHKHYVGLDLGTGTGILLLAQYIQAIRNGFTSMVNVGIEIDPSTVQHTSRIASKLGIGNVIRGDTTKKDVYEVLHDIGAPITFISNENIPTTGIAMDGKNDPFHQNNKMIYQTDIRNKLLVKTQTFPSEIAMTLKMNEQFQRTIVGAHTNGFLAEFLNKFESTIKEDPGFETVPDRTVLQHLFVEGIKINGNMIPLHNIGRELIDNGMVSRLSQRRHRWSEQQLKATQAMNA